MMTKRQQNRYEEREEEVDEDREEVEGEEDPGAIKWCFCAAN